MIETATRRSNIYGLLTLIFRTEITKQVLQQIKEPEFLSALSNMGARLDDDFLQKNEDELIEDLAVEYSGLFIGPDKHISPHESIHHDTGDGDWGQLWGRSTVEIKKFIEAAGLEFRPEYAGMPDHISVEFEFMRQAAKREAQAREEDDSDGTLYCLKMEKMFIEEHLMKWVPVFCDKVIESAGHFFYREIAKVTKRFMEFESEGIDRYLSEAQKEAS